MAIKGNWTRMVELGLWKGRTFLWMLHNCPRLTMIGVDAWEYRPEHDDEDAAEGAQSYAHWNMRGLERYVRTRSKPFGDRAIIHKMRTTDAAPLVEDASVDCVFIDADHSSEGVRTDIENWLPKVKLGGILSGHDIDWPSVKDVVDDLFGDDYKLGPDNVWFIHV